MYLNPSQQESPSAAAIPLSVARELIHDLRNRAQQAWIQAENSVAAPDRERHAARSEAFIEAAEIVERSIGRLAEHERAANHRPPR